ncbi:MAG: DUF222 domain-containing protein [Nakamurella sp.]
MSIVEPAGLAGSTPHLPALSCEALLRRVLAKGRTQRRLAARRLDLNGVCRDHQRRTRNLLRHHPVITSWLDVDLVVQPFPAERIAALDGAVIDPDWIGELAALAELPPEAVPAGAMLSMVGQLHRLAGWAQATGVRWTAAFAQPGVAVPVGQLLDLAGSAASDLCVHQSHPVQPTDRDFECVSYQDTTVCGDPAWDAVMATHAARQAAVELGAVLHLSPITARRRTEEALTFVEELPATLDRWRVGQLDRSRAVVIAEATKVLAPDTRAAVEGQLLAPDPAPGADPTVLTPGRLRTLVDRLVIDADPDVAQHRADLAFADRKTQVTPIGENMARFSADLLAPDALLADEVLDSIAQSLPTDSRGGRTLSQLRADSFADLFTTLARYGHIDLRQPQTQPRPDTRPDGTATNPPDCGCPDAPNQWKPLGHSVSVTIAASTLACLDNHPAQLARYGWITADLARALTESARSVTAIIWRDPPDPEVRATTSSPPGQSGQPDPIDTGPPDTHQCHDGCIGSEPANSRWCGTDLDYGRRTYRPPAALQELINQRDRTCRFPGCHTPAQRCDQDHRAPYNRADPLAGGVTCPCNLDNLCRFHHRTKTFTRWTATREPGNALQWTSPHGHQFTDQPEPLPLGTTFTSGDLDLPPY